jgi:hypothetical protein
MSDLELLVDLGSGNEIDNPSRLGYRDVGFSKPQRFRIPIRFTSNT